MWATGNSRKPVVSSEVGEMWTIWNSWIHTHARTRTHILPVHFSLPVRRRNVGNLKCTQMFDQAEWGKGGQFEILTDTHTFTLHACPRRPVVYLFCAVCNSRALTWKQTGKMWAKWNLHSTHAHEERGDVRNSKCPNKNKHTRRHTYVQEDRENVDSTNAHVHIFWLLVDCWQCGDLLKTGSRSRTDVLYKFLEANFTV